MVKLRLNDGRYSGATTGRKRTGHTETAMRIPCENRQQIWYAGALACKKLRMMGCLLPVFNKKNVQYNALAISWNIATRKDFCSNSKKKSYLCKLI